MDGLKYYSCIEIIEFFCETQYETVARGEVRGTGNGKIKPHTMPPEPRTANILAQLIILIIFVCLSLKINAKNYI